ncbi:MAG: hypothetical protein M1826_000187 [Phylliscum demangeonii]|nr:MAG: hypothetical protein M1826_000187 [Phylliscum demangeonii]
MAPTLAQAAFSTWCLLSSLAATEASSRLQKRLATPANLPAGWTSQGCYLDNVNGGRALSGAAYQNGTGMTDEACISFCDGNGFVFAGTEYSTECYCGNSIAAGNTATAAGDCNMACSGDATEACGSGNRLNVFKSSKPAASGPVTNPGPSPWAFAGCYTDGGARTLNVGMATTGGGAALTVALCTSACQAANYALAGVEYAGECFCGNSFANGGAPAPDGLSGCNMVCNGNSTEYCGGPNRLDVYSFKGAVQAAPSTTATTTAGTPPTGGVFAPNASPSATGVPGWNALGCYTDGGARTLTAFATASNTMTIESCLATCKANGYALAGVEYASECYCDNAFRNGGGPAPDGNANCNMACSGNAQETCGGPNRLNIFRQSGAATSGTAGGTTTAAGSPTTTGAGSATGLPTGWAYAGCYVDGAHGRILSYNQPDSQTLTVESCVQACVGLGYTVAGMEFSTQCFCGNAVINGGTLAPADTDCSMTCSGNGAEKCGAGNRMSIYSHGALQVLPAPAPQKGGLPGAWQYQGCLTDSGNPRTFPWQLILTNNNSATNCLSQCSTFGYNAGGMEYGDECYCGDVANIATAGATLAPEADCSTPCSGNASAICGNGARLSYYTWTGPALYSWKFGSGQSAGQYQFLIGGVVVPLSTTLGINGKVAFLEKYGTSQSGNSTGAYELDLTQLNNFSKAWRPMHVKTDVFCSAGLTLPDKAGRQISVGGWSAPSTSGLRLYWPDGSPGVASTNDWQENVNELSLQTGRWYPSAMVMANGSVLVVGGETGSNAAAVPSLEILPATGGGLYYAEWLERTNPNNLYPFLAVLPSGGIFVGYYNEARILDEKSLNTIVQLPNMPGAVNNFLSGRSYPLEGTAVLLPQRAPYTDPLTVLVCGGSTAGAGTALDNCVSIQPDVPKAQWTIERMPSKRVMACMAALPDGTYLILNGAHQGVAGFGLANDPNLNAVLYDPTLPVNKRMTIMANTTVARMYHSEAILLQDGRVLVTGSDPQDNVNPEEYRVEVFVPPYLLAGKARPAFTLPVTDWAYGQQYTFTLTAGNAANVRVSLLGAVTSTHGNSMGQRTIFPAVSCAGNTCKVTAPPDRHTCPPGWFQLFVLDGNMPSISTFVRIGGDPAQLGNWPNFPDFKIPGV